MSGRDCGIVSVGRPNAHVGRDRLFMKGRDGVCVKRREAVFARLFGEDRLCCLLMRDCV